MKNVGFIGYGIRGRCLIKAVESLEAKMNVTAIVDPREQEIAKQIQGNPLFANVTFYPDAQTMLNSEKLDGVFVSTRCDTHTEFTKTVLASDAALFLEKPVAINQQQLDELREVLPKAKGRTTVSFPLRLTAICRQVRSIIARGDIGEITMVQAVNNVPYGSVYFHDWYRDESLTGGLYLQKMTHDIDYIAYLTGMQMVEVRAQSTKLYYQGTQPAGLRCPECTQYHTCPESSYVVKHIYKDGVTGDHCCFATDTGNHDTASVIFTMENGALVSYNQNFIAKKSAQRRGCRVIGTQGSVEFDFYTGEIRLDCYRTNQIVTHRITPPAGLHFGGDEALILDFISVMEGGEGVCGLEDGIRSAQACVSARLADEQNTSVIIPQTTT